MKVSSKSPLSLAWSQTLFRRLVLDGFRLPTGFRRSAGVSGRIIGKLTRHPSSNGNHDWFAHIGAMSVLSPTLAYSILWSILPRRMNGGEAHGLRFDHGWTSASIPSACGSGRKLKQRLAASCDEQQKCSCRMVPIWLPDCPMRNQSLQSRDDLDSLYIFHPAWCSVWIDRFLARYHSFILIAMFDRVREWIPLCGWCKLLLLCCLQQQNVAIAEMCYKGLNVYESCLQFQYVYVVHSLLPCPGSCTCVLTGCATSCCQGIWCDYYVCYWWYYRVTIGFSCFVNPPVKLSQEFLDHPC